METQPIEVTADHAAQAALEQLHELTTQCTQMRAAVISLQAQLAAKQAELDGLRAETGASKGGVTYNDHSTIVNPEAPDDPQTP